MAAVGRVTVSLRRSIMERAYYATAAVQGSPRRSSRGPSGARRHHRAADDVLDRGAALRGERAGDMVAAVHHDVEAAIEDVAVGRGQRHGARGRARLVGGDAGAGGVGNV